MPAYMTTEMTISAFTGSRCAIIQGDGWAINFFDEKDKDLRKKWESHVASRIFRTEIDLIKELGDWFRHQVPKP